MNETEISSVWPDWAVEGVLGTGPFGTVYLIRSEAEGNTAFAAGKVIRVPPKEEAVKSAEAMGISRDLLTTYFARFKNDLNWELTMFRTVKSSHLVSVEDVTVVDAAGPGFTAYIRTGIYTPLSIYYDKAPATQDDAARLGREICSALEACSDFGMVHGEIKPENVLVADSGSFVLADFGVKRCLEKAGTSIFGAVDSGFEAPELKRERKYSAVTDVYALGTLLEYVANGCKLPENRDPDLIPGLDKDFAAVIARATAEEPAERYQSASEFRTALMKLPHGRKAPRRAMAAAAAFDMVKKNGGAIRTAVPAAAAAITGAKTAKNQRPSKPVETQEASVAQLDTKTEQIPKTAMEAKPEPKHEVKREVKSEPKHEAKSVKPQLYSGRRASVSSKRTYETRERGNIEGVSWLKPVLAAAVLVVFIIVLLIVKPWESTPKTPGGVKTPDNITLGDTLKDDPTQGDSNNTETKNPSGTEADDPGGTGGNTPDDPDGTGGNTPDAPDGTGGNTPDNPDGTGGNTPDTPDGTGGNTPDDPSGAGENTPDVPSEPGGDSNNDHGGEEEPTSKPGEDGKTDTPEYVSEGIAVGGGVVTATALNIRSGPGTDYKVLGGAPKDDVVVVLERTSDEWLKVNYHGIIGYSSAKYITGIREAKNFTATGMVLGDNTRLRSGPGTDKDILGGYNKGAVLTVVGINTGWYKVVDGDTVGYIRSDLMAITG